MTPADRERLATCDPILQAIVAVVDKFWPVAVVQGQRTKEEQAENVKKGVSKTLNSKHVLFPSRAIDMLPAPVEWPDAKGITPEESARRWKRIHVFAGFVQGVAHTMGEDLVWGGDWDGDWDFTDQKFHDLPHFELKGP